MNDAMRRRLTRSKQKFKITNKSLKNIRMDHSPKNRILTLIRDNPYLSQQELAVQVGISRSAVAGHIAALTREGQILGRAYVLPQAQRPIVCIGGANIDRKVHTLQPLVMGTSNPVRVQETFGGVARNLAENLARLGAPTQLLTAVGQDAAGQHLLQAMQQLGVDTSGCLQAAGMSSGTYTAVLNDTGEMVLALAHMDVCARQTPEWLQQCAVQRNAAGMIVADLNLPADSVAQLIHDAAQSTIPLMIVAVSEPKMTNLPVDLHGVALLILNLGELQTRVARPLNTEDEIAAACREVQMQGARNVMVTRGAQGIWYTDGEHIRHLAAPSVKVRDVTGAGDAFSSAVCWSLYHAPDDLAVAARRGVALSARTVQSEQSVLPDLHADLLESVD